MQGIRTDAGIELKPVYMLHGSAGAFKWQHYFSSLKEKKEKYDEARSFFQINDKQVSASTAVCSERSFDLS